MKVIVACEESQVVCKAFRARGHEAYSCDILPCSGGHPEWHIQDDVMNVIPHAHRYGQKTYFPIDDSGLKWDLMIAHPPCTYLANSGVSHLYMVGAVTENGTKIKVPYQPRWDLMMTAGEFFARLLCADIEKIAIENPIPHKYALDKIDECLWIHYRRHDLDPRYYPRNPKYDQIIHPWQFGHMEQKPTCLWLKNVPALTETDNVKQDMQLLPANKRQRIHYMPPSGHRAQDRAVTYEGIAEAMADQWGSL